MRQEAESVVSPERAQPWRPADLVTVARPRQWTKNAVCAAALVFSGQLRDPASQLGSLLVVVCFCLASSAVYIVNDVTDRALDRVHPVKRLRPVAAGRLPVGLALGEAALLAAAALALSATLPPRARWILLAFLALHAGYSAGLKRLVIIDVMIIAVGFALRVQAGVEAIRAPQSAWILLCMFSVALFLGFGKRRAELALLAGGPPEQRPVLQAYSIEYLDVGLGVSATMALVSYALYAVTVQRNETFLLTVLPVAFGILRYMQLAVVRSVREDPDESLTRDLPIIAAVLVWTVLCVLVLYFGLQLFPTAR
jgi:4-hydroxybenzoate polyprenyltransferase